MWELDCEECWVQKNWRFWTVVLEKALESPLDYKEIQPVHSKGDESWVFFGRTDAKAETPILGHLMWRVESLEKTLMLGGIRGRRRRGRQRMRWLDGHHRLDGHEFGWTPGVGDGQRTLECCDSWGCKESDMTEWLNWTELNWCRLNLFWLRRKREGRSGETTKFREWSFMEHLLWVRFMCVYYLA